MVLSCMKKDVKQEVMLGFDYLYYQELHWTIPGLKKRVLNNYWKSKVYRDDRLAPMGTYGSLLDFDFRAMLAKD